MEHLKEFTNQGYRIQLDLSRQVLGLDIPEEKWSAEESPLRPTLPRRWPAGFVSAAALAMKAKQFDDGLYAATELAAQNGAGRYPGKMFLLKTLARSLGEATSADATEALAVLFGACGLGGLNTAVPQSTEAAVEETVAAFLRDELRSKPIGFYTWTRDLETIFRQDRLLQSPLRGEAGIKALVHALIADDQLRSTYVNHLNLIARLTNPFAEPDLRPLLAAAEKDRQQARPNEIFFFPPSRAHETDLIMKLFRDNWIPDGFNLMDELIGRIRSGALQLQPTEQSGWYDYQIWSIEPLAIPERTLEAKRLRIDERYREHLLDLFKGIYALTRETHVKQLDLPKPGCPAPRVEPVKIYIRPELSAEPLATFYLRRALSYRFVRHVIAETFGPDTIGRLHRLRPTDPGKLNLAEELDEMESLFYGAHATVSRQLGLAADSTAEVGSGKGPEADAERFKKWASNLEGDEDLGQDARMMVPVFYDRGRRKTKVWLFLGWTSKYLRIYFDTPPRVVHLEEPGAAPAVTGLLGRLFGKRGQPEIVFTEAYTELACPVTAEVYVEKILNRDEFRRHCDTYKTQSAILANLS
jgi:hypothetical protein